MCDICIDSSIPVCFDTDGVCGLHGDDFAQNHTDDSWPVCNWFAGMFTHDDYDDSCRGCKK